MDRFHGLTDEDIARRLAGLSKYLSYILRHHPEQVGLMLGEGGWVAVDDLLAGIAAHGEPLDRATLEVVVRTNQKKRFALSEDGRFIRANQGHSTEVDLQLEALPPPAVLWHGTVAKALDGIRQHGLLKMNRHHVHLSGDDATARAVAARRGKPVLLTVDAAAMASDGFVFHRSANGVWLVDGVPPGYLTFPEPRPARPGPRR